MTEPGGCGSDKNVNPTTLSVLLQDIVEGMGFQSELVSLYLNTATGEIDPIAEETLAAVDAGEDIDPMTGESLDSIRSLLTGTEFIPLPDRFEIDEYRMMERFAQAVADQSISDTLFRALKGSGAFRRFKDTVKHLGLADNWYEFRDHAYEEIAIGWCKEQGIEYHR
ncbi:MAG: hypothetical protein KAT79_04395 [candidate division Zixibacteria bacterium]|nr:hypothetical protein [candidate division Zixibacteria bacterium]